MAIQYHSAGCLSASPPRELSEEAHYAYFTWLSSKVTLSLPVCFSLNHFLLYLGLIFWGILWPDAAQFHCFICIFFIECLLLFPSPAKYRAKCQLELFPFQRWWTLPRKSGPPFVHIKSSADRHARNGCIQGKRKGCLCEA